MKQYSRIFQYLRNYKGKIFLYFTFTLLSILFSIVSIGMLTPFLQLIFLGNAGGVNTSSNAVLKAINNIMDKLPANDMVAKLGLICLMIVIFIILKNLFLYLSYYILNPLKNKVVNQLREELYDKVLKLPIGFFTEKR